VCLPLWSWETHHALLEKQTWPMMKNFLTLESIFSPFSATLISLCLWATCIYSIRKGNIYFYHKSTTNWKSLSIFSKYLSQLCSVRYVVIRKRKRKEKHWVNGRVNNSQNIMVSNFIPFLQYLIAWIYTIWLMNFFLFRIPR